MISPFRHEVRTIGRLAAPVVATQLGQMMLWTVDLAMVGAVGVDALGALALGRQWLFATIILAQGIVFGADPIFTQAWGARDEDLLGLTLQRALVVAAAISVPVAIAWGATEEVLLAFGQDRELSAVAELYLLVQLPVIPMFLVFTALRQYLLARGILTPPMWVVLAGNVLNLFGNWVLIFGKLGLPAMGIVGAGIATTVTQAAMLVALAAWVVRGRLYRGAWIGWSRRAWQGTGLASIFRYGLPVGAQLSLEVWAFSAATLFAGWLGTTALAAHNIVLNLASISFMVPLGVSLGTVTRVGNLIGEGRPAAAQRAAWAGFALGAAVMATFALVFMIGRGVLPRIYSADAAVLAACAALLPIAAAFQLFDGTQVVGGGILRAMGRTRPAAVFNLLGYYALALPLGYMLAFRAGFGLPGLWWGLAAGLAVVAGLLLTWVARRGPAKVDARVRELGGPPPQG